MNRCRRRWLFGLTLCWSTGSWAANAELDAYFTERWYATELIIFQRPAVLEINTTEALAQQSGRSYPYNIRSFFQDACGAGYRLGPLTQLTLEYPSRPPQISRIVEIVALEDTAPPPVLLGDPPPAIEPKLEPHPFLDFLHTISRFEKRLLEQSYQWLTEDRLRLSAEANRMQQRPELKILWHGRWIQPVPARDAPQPLLIQLGRAFGDIYQLEGTLEVTIGRYLHFRPRLWYHEPGLGFELSYVSRELDRKASDVPNGKTPWQPPANLIGNYMVLDESRTMRSEELHYLDHPKLGIVMRIDPIEPSADVVDAFDALEAFREASTIEETDE